MTKFSWSSSPWFLVPNQELPCGKKYLSCTWAQRLRVLSAWNTAPFPFQHYFKHQHCLTFSSSFLMGQVSQVTASLNSSWRPLRVELSLKEHCIYYLFKLFISYKEGSSKIEADSKWPNLLFFLVLEQEQLFFILMCRCILAATRKNKLFTITALPTERPRQELSQHWKGQQSKRCES